MDFNKIKFTLLPSPPDPRDWKVSKVLRKVLLPGEIDYTSDMQPIRDQGSQGSCAAMAASAMKEWQERKDVALNEYMSPQFIYNNRIGFPNSEGMYTRDVTDILTKNGDCREVTFKYGNQSKPPQSAYDEASKYPIGGYAFCDTIDDVKTALATNGPCLVAFPVYNFSMRFWYKNPGEYLLGYHMVLICGYSDSKRRFTIRNSWSTDWGDRGYTYFGYDDWGWNAEIVSTIDTDSDDYIPPKPEPEPEPDDVKWYEHWYIAVILAILLLIVYFIVK